MSLCLVVILYSFYPNTRKKILLVLFIPFPLSLSKKAPLPFCPFLVPSYLSHQVKVSTEFPCETFILSSNHFISIISYVEEFCSMSCERCFLRVQMVQKMKVQTFFHCESLGWLWCGGLFSLEDGEKCVCVWGGDFHPTHHKLGIAHTKIWNLAASPSFGGLHCIHTHIQLTHKSFTSAVSMAFACKCFHIIFLNKLLDEVVLTCVDVRSSFYLLNKSYIYFSHPIFLQIIFKFQKTVKDHKENEVIHVQGLIFCLEMIITHIVYCHHFMTLILFFYVMIKLRITVKKIIHKPPFITTGSINPDNPNHRGLTKPTQISQAMKICWWRVDLSNTHSQPHTLELGRPTRNSGDQSSFFPPWKMSHSCCHSPPSLYSNLPRLLSVCYGDKADLQPSAQWSVQNHNMLYIIKLSSPLGYSSKHCDCIIAKGFLYLGRGFDMLSTLNQAEFQQIYERVIVSAQYITSLTEIACLQVSWKLPRCLRFHQLFFFCARFFFSTPNCFPPGVFGGGFAVCHGVCKLQTWRFQVQEPETASDPVTPAISLIINSTSKKPPSNMGYTHFFGCNNMFINELQRELIMRWCNGFSEIFCQYEMKGTGRNQMEDPFQNKRMAFILSTRPSELLGINRLNKRFSKESKLERLFHDSRLISFNYSKSEILNSLIHNLKIIMMFFRCEREKNHDFNHQPRLLHTMVNNLQKKEVFCDPETYLTRGRCGKKNHLKLNFSHSDNKHSPLTLCPHTHNFLSPLSSYAPIEFPHPQIPADFHSLQHRPSVHLTPQAPRCANSRPPGSSASLVCPRTALKSNPCLPNPPPMSNPPPLCPHLFSAALPPLLTEA
ncbi:hypothetical protein VP01_1172g3 [Puccinia sorghi]|uniref:Uncharacterized protein n=1 Tax=Puccinia sorghi TaxID=27349 RepID=A0A0L6VR67_9BASI|nr:hypothetical protein VP01_1172g3 [Puccinia sorghi]